MHLKPRTFVYCPESAHQDNAPREQRGACRQLTTSASVFKQSESPVLPNAVNSPLESRGWIKVFLSSAA